MQTFPTPLTLGLSLHFIWYWIVPQVPHGSTPEDSSRGFSKGPASTNPWVDRCHQLKHGQSWKMTEVSSGNRGKKFHTGGIWLIWPENGPSAGIQGHHIPATEGGNPGEAPQDSPWSHSWNGGWGFLWTSFFAAQTPSIIEWTCFFWCWSCSISGA